MALLAGFLGPSVLDEGILVKTQKAVKVKAQFITKNDKTAVQGKCEP